MRPLTIHSDEDGPSIPLDVREEFGGSLLERCNWLGTHGLKLAREVPGRKLGFLGYFNFSVA